MRVFATEGGKKRIKINIVNKYKREREREKWVN